MATADLNGDGKRDVVTANYDGFSVSVLINLGKGLFAPAVDYPAGPYPSAVTTADFNGDNRPDLAVANLAGDTVSVLLNLGNGTFAPAADHTTGQSPSSVTAADLNGDGKIDLAVTSQGGSGAVSVLLNLGTAPLRPGSTTPRGSARACSRRISTAMASPTSPSRTRTRTP